MPSSAADPDKDHGSSFGERAALYAAYRPAYPSEIFTRLFAHLEGAREDAVDLGAGSGQATKELAKRFSRVTAVEPDARMAARYPAISNVTVVNAAAEDADFADASVDAVISATAFHWMDQKKVCAAVARWLRPGGVFFPFLYGPFRMDGAVADTYRRHFALWGPYRDARLGSNVDYEKSISASGAFRIAERFGMEMKAPLTPDEAAGLILTMSYASAYARDHGGLDAYRARLLEEFEPFRNDIILASHLGGVIAVKAG